MLGVGVLLVVAAPVASLIMTSSLEPTYLWFCAILIAGFLCSANGAAAYNLGIASARLRGNIVVNLAALVALTGLWALLGPIVPVFGGALATAAGLAVAGIGPRLLNEPLLSPTQDAR